MSLEPIEVNLNAFERLSILRRELQHLERECEEVEGRLRSSLEAEARRSYLASLSPYFRTREESAQEESDPAELSRRREAVHQALEAVRRQIPVLEAEIASGAAPAAAPRPSERAARPAARPRTDSQKVQKRLPSFDDF